MSKEDLRSWDGHDSERWHLLAKRGLHLAESIPGGLRAIERIAGERVIDERLHVDLAGLELENPLIVGAGWDKTGESIAALHRMGFAGVEVGSVLAFPQAGNEKPRQWMIAPGVSLNRLGFNSPGRFEVADNLERYKRKNMRTGVVGVSIGKNKDAPEESTPEVHFLVASSLYKYADYFVINVSSPNTPGLRELQDKKPLTNIVRAVNHAMFHEGDGANWKKPVFIKIAPDNLTPGAVNDIIEVVFDNELAGIIATNTTVNPELKAKYGEVWREEMGGLAGDDPDYRRMSTEMIKYIYGQTEGKLEIIGVGGVKNAETAYEKILAGAKAVQIVTGIRGSLPLRKAMLKQPKLANKINRGLIELLKRDGFSSISEAVGKAA